MSQQPENESHKKIRHLTELLKTRYRASVRRLQWNRLFYFTGIAAAGFLILALLESAFYLSAEVKITGIVITGILAAVITHLITRNSAFDSYNNFTRRFLTSRSKDGEKIQNLIDLYTNEKHQKSIFYEAAIDANLATVKIDEVDADLAQFLKQRPLYKHKWSSAGFALSALAGIFIFAAIAPGSTQRALTFWEEFEQPNPYTFSVQPGSTTVEHGQIIQPEIEFRGEHLPEKITFFYKTEVEEDFRERPMQLTEDATYETREIEATAAISYRIQMDKFSTENYHIDVQLQPRFESLLATVIPPSYTGLPEQDFEYPFSAIDLYPGSEVQLQGKTNKMLEELFLKSSDNQQTLSLSEQDSIQQFSYNFQPVKADTFSFEMFDKEGLQNKNPFRFNIQLREDESPMVVIREPTGTVMENEPGEMEILYQVTDDFGIERTELQWEIYKEYVEDPERGGQQLSEPENGRNTRTQWNLSELGLSPRDEVHFWIRALDNDAVNGGKWGESQRVTIRIPSLAETFDEMDSKERDVQNELDEVSESFDQMKQEYERFMERMRQNPEGGFEEQEMLENVTEQQQQIDETVKQLQEQFDELRKEIEESGSVSDETRESYQELQKLMDELDDPELQEALQELHEAMENMNPQQMEQALENVSFNEELYKERLERTKELFKQLKMNSDLDKLAQQYEDLSERLNKQQESDSDLEQFQQEMETMNEDMEKLSEQLEQIDDNPPKRSAEQLKQLKEEAGERLDDIQEQMEQMQEDASEQMEQGESQPGEQTQQQQEQISEQLKEEADKIREQMQQMSGEQIQINLLALQRALYTLLELSETQEFLTKNSQETENRSAGFVNLARQQNYVSDQFSAVADTIFQVSSELPGVPNRINQKKAEVEQTLQRSVDQMEERNKQGATITTRESLGGINELSSTIASLIDQLMEQSGDSGGGGNMSMQQMMEQMQQMSGDQQQLNQQLQEFVNDLQGDRLNREQSERLEQLARQQNEIRRQLQELQKSGALGEGDKALSELQRMIEEMEDSINDMRGGVTDRLMIERQQNILSRMLNAEEAMEQRGEEDEREGSRAEQFDSDLPPDMTLEELQQEIRSRLQDPNYTRFSEEYQRLIERYFEHLRRMDEVMP